MSLFSPLTEDEKKESADIRAQFGYHGPEPERGPRRALENPHVCPIRCRKYGELVGDEQED